MCLTSYLLRFCIYQIEDVCGFLSSDISTPRASAALVPGFHVRFLWVRWASSILSLYPLHDSIFTVPLTFRLPEASACPDFQVCLCIATVGFQILFIFIIMFFSFFLIFLLCLDIIFFAFLCQPLVHWASLRQLSEILSHTPAINFCWLFLFLWMGHLVL